MADDAGALLVRSGLVTPTALEEARARVDKLGGTLGEHLVFGASISDDALTDFYRSRLLVPQVNPNTLARLPVRVIAAISSDMAIELRAIPVALDAENNLTVAMSDPSDRHAVDEIAFFTGAYVVRAVATQMQIAWCLAHYYGHVTALGQRLLQGGDPAPQPAPASPALVAAPAPRKKGLTAKVEAMRHRGIVPATGPVNVPRPQSGQIAAAAPVTEPESAPAPVAVVEAPPPEVTPPDLASDGVPEKPRPRSISGEIRIPGRRAPSIRPATEDPLEDESGPVITVEVSPPNDEEETGPRKPAPRRRKAKTDPPELAARAGEVAIAIDRERRVDEGPGIIISDDLLEPPPQEDRTGEFEAAPRREFEDSSSGAPVQTIEVSDEASEGVVIHERYDRESEPVLLDRRRPSDPPTTVTQRAPSSADDPDDDDVVVLDAKKPFTRTVRPARPTVVGIGALPAVTRAHRDTEAGMPDLDDPTGVDTPVVAPGPDDPSSDEIAAPPAPARDDTSLHNLAEPPKPTSSRAAMAPARKHAPTVDDLDDDDDDDDDDRGPATSVMSVVELDDAIPQRTADIVPAHLATKRNVVAPIDHDEVDDGWGPPGTTIPPPLLGAIPGSADDDVPGRIPVSNLDTAPLIVAPPSPPDAARGAPAAELAPQTPSRAHEDATSRLLDLIRMLEHATDRDGVVGMMVAHLAETHRRAGFFVVKPGAAKGITELSVFSIEPRPLTLPFATLRLDRPSTLQDVVGTRLPYRGPTHDEASRIFLAGVLGVAPVEILLVPVTVRERVVGVLFAEHRLRHTFDDQIALAARAAGVALERILMAKRG